MDEITKEEQIENWLRIGLSQPQDRLSEIFYFDRRDNQFFSILVADYFHFDKNYNIPKNAVSSYPESTLIVLADRMKRIENVDKSIITLSRTKKGEDSTDEYLNRKMEAFLNLNSIVITTATIWEVDEIGSVTINLLEDESEIDIKKQKSWWEFWR
ncbi:hypothetical protein [Flavobacterium tructae]|uniref:Uncharacterized protein n=1 Tax=Flavobacterium tructae TaxID=1114873 RepID=A0A1S1J412_9FLAO|nr:hypothetical protein [Flavobacterium tructae]OHT45392.1 hypothetical protein BHE19_06005 [Flavobacterium tructae]OXB13472.1 hypothetical protein B0A71_22220 [Flavobacterium tructae]